MRPTYPSVSGPRVAQGYVRAEREHRGVASRARPCLGSVTWRAYTNQTMPALIRDDALVLRTHKLGEADRIITLLTRHHGKVRAVAKGVRRTGSRFGARLEPFGLIDVQFYQGKSLHTVTQVVSIESFAQAITADYARYTAASAMLEAADRLTDETAESSPRGFLLLVGALRAVASGAVAPELLLDSFLIRSVALSGWTPELTVCASCGGSGPHFAFDVAAGGLVCSECRRPGARALTQKTREHLIFLLAGDWPNVVESDDIVRREASTIIADVLTWNIERGVRALNYVERSTTGDIRELRPS